jgi:hypothetical protein
VTTPRTLIGHQDRRSSIEREQADFLRDEFKNTPIPADEILGQIGVFQNHIQMARVLWFAHLYERIIDVPGSICMFGVRWGQDMAILGNLRALHEPYNHLRRIIGFDTFAGFPSVAQEDGVDTYAAPGNYAVTQDYETRLTRILDAHEAVQPIPQIRKHELVKGDASVKLPAYLQANPSLVISLAYLDFDIFAPTRAVLEAISPHLARGSVVAFDQFAHPKWPGETLACMAALKFGNLRLRRVPFLPNPAYFIVE